MLSPSFRVCNRGKIRDRNCPPRTYNKNGAFVVEDSFGKSGLSSCNSNKDQAVLLADLPIVVGGSLSGGVSEVLRVVLVRGYAVLELRAVLVVGVASLGLLMVSVIRVVFSRLKAVLVVGVLFLTVSLCLMCFVFVFLNPIRIGDNNPLCC